MITEIRNQTRQEEGTTLLLRYVGRSNIKTMNSNCPECCPLPPQFCDATIAPLFLLYMSSILMRGKVILKQVPSWTHVGTICFFEPFPVLRLGHRYRKTSWDKQSLPGLKTSMLRPDKMLRKCGCYVGYLLLALMMHMELQLPISKSRHG